MKMPIIGQEGIGEGGSPSKLLITGSVIITLVKWRMEENPLAQIVLRRSLWLIIEMFICICK